VAKYSVSTIIQLWKYINLRNPEDGDDTFSETLGHASATRYKVPEDIPEDSGLRILIVSLHEEAK
jgi:hypothetical protein